MGFHTFVLLFPQKLGDLRWFLWHKMSLVCKISATKNEEGIFKQDFTSEDRLTEEEGSESAWMHNGRRYRCYQDRNLWHMLLQRYRFPQGSWYLVFFFIPGFLFSFWSSFYSLVMYHKESKMKTIAFYDSFLWTYAWLRSVLPIFLLIQSGSLQNSGILLVFPAKINV